MSSFDLAFIAALDTVYVLVALAGLNSLDAPAGDDSVGALAFIADVTRAFASLDALPDFRLPVVSA